jgi:predicted secreted Zn-dependent protease
MIRGFNATLAAVIGVPLLASVPGCAASAPAGGAAEAPGAPVDAPGSPVIVRRAVAQYEFYDVPGSTAGELAAEMDELGPVVEGRPALAATFWDVGWTYQTEEAAGLCVIRRVDMRLDVRVALPRWTPPASASPLLVADWNRFVRAVSEHEAGHVDLAAEAARRVRSRLTGMSGPSCAALQARASEEGDKIIAEYRERNRQFDERPGNEAEKWPPSRLGAARRGP